MCKQTNKKNRILHEGATKKETSVYENDKYHFQ